jgi:hypothetical protein
LRDILAPFGAALLATALEALGRFAWGGPYLPELMAEKFFTLIPVWAFTPLFRAFGYGSKYYAFGGMIAGEVAALTLVGTAVRGWMRRRPGAGGAFWLTAAVASSVAAAILIGLLPLLDAGIAGQALPGGIWLAVPTFVVVAGSYVAVLTRGVSR